MRLLGVLEGTLAGLALLEARFLAGFDFPEYPAVERLFRSLRAGGRPEAHPHRLGDDLLAVQRFTAGGEHLRGRVEERELLLRGRGASGFGCRVGSLVFRVRSVDGLGFGSRFFRCGIRFGDDSLDAANLEFPAGGLTLDLPPIGGDLGLATNPTTAMNFLVSKLSLSLSFLQISKI